MQSNAMADSHHYIHSGATATLLAAWRSLVSFDWLEYGERGRYRQDNVQLIRDFIFSCFMESFCTQQPWGNKQANGSSRRISWADECASWAWAKNALLAVLTIIHQLESFIRLGQFVRLIDRAKNFVAEVYSMTSYIAARKAVHHLEYYSHAFVSLLSLIFCHSFGHNCLCCRSVAAIPCPTTPRGTGGRITINTWGHWVM